MNGHLSSADLYILWGCAILVTLSDTELSWLKMAVYNHPLVGRCLLYPKKITCYNVGNGNVEIVILLKQQFLSWKVRWVLRVFENIWITKKKIGKMIRFKIKSPYFKNSPAMIKLSTDSDSISPYKSKEALLIVLPFLL